MQLWEIYNSSGRHRAPSPGRRHAAWRGIEGLLPDHPLLGVAPLIIIIGYDDPC
nr:MAG TPA: hypothetical protein [Caudoviricetes sp.]